MKLAVPGLMITLFVLSAAGCATHRTVVVDDDPERTTTTVSTSASTPVPQTRAVQTTQTTTTTTHTDRDSDVIVERRYGLIGGLFHLVGEVIAFPFRVIGGIFSAIF